jgi:polysaccharide export outer membrane protein
MNTKSGLWRTALTVLGLGVATLGAAAQSAGTAAPQAPAPAFVNLNSVSKDYQVGPGDLLDIQVIGHTDMNQALRISNSGEISFPMLGVIKVADMTTFEVEDAIAEQLRQNKLIEDAQVLAFVREYQAKPVYVQGAVVNPGEFIMSQELTVVDAILLAGGLHFHAADEALLHRRRSESQAPAGDAPRTGIETIKVDLRPLKQGRFMDNTLVLKRGDTLVVPDMQMNPFYIVGEVLEPRNYFVQPGRTLMASQAISWAGGPTPTAKLSDGMLVRYDANGQRQELKVNYADILQGKQKDFPIEPNDIIFVPGSKVKTITQGMLLLTDTMVMSTSFRIARSYQMPDAPALTRESR